MAAKGDQTEVRLERVPFESRLLLDTKAAAEMFSMSPQTFEKLPIKQVHIPGIRRVYYRMADLELYARSL